MTRVILLSLLSRLIPNVRKFGINKDNIAKAIYHIEREEVLAQTLQVPSLLTMQAPTGFEGVQAFINMGHLLGFILPIITK